VVQAADLPARFRDLRLQVRHGLGLLSLQGPELSELGGEPVACRDLFIACGLFSLALRLQVRQIAVER